MSKKRRRAKSSKKGPSSAPPKSVATQDPEPRAGQAASAHAVDPVQESLPPVEFDHQFFESPASRSSHVEHAIEPEERDPRIAQKLSPTAARRRAELAKYVNVAVGFAAAVCVAAAGKVLIVHHAPGTDARADVRPPQAAAMSVLPMEAPSTTVSAAPAAALAPAGRADEGASAPVASESAAAAASATPAALEPDTKEAAKAKVQAQRELDRGKVTDAIDAGEKAVRLDPTDSEAWLILGAAYQQKGDMKNARRCYKSCLAEGRHGSKTECAEMLRL